MALRLITPRWLAGPGSSSTASHKNGIWQMYWLTACSSGCSARRTAAPALEPLPQLPATAGSQSVSVDQSCANMQAEDRTAMIATAAFAHASMPAEAFPERCPAAAGPGMCAHPHHTQALPRVDSNFSRLKKEVNAASRPIHALITVCKGAFAAQLALQCSQEIIKAAQVVQAVHVSHPTNVG